MQRLIPILAALLFAGSLQAQEYERNRLGIRAGIEAAYLRASGELVEGTTRLRTGFRIGVSDQIQPWRNIPPSLETGVHFASRGGSYSGVSFRPMYLQIPLLVGWRFGLGSEWTLRLYAGGWYGVGIGGKARTADDWIDLFGEQGMLRRSDAGVRGGFELSWRRCSLNAGFDTGLCNLLRNGELPLLPAGISRVWSRSFTLSFGYDF